MEDYLKIVLKLNEDFFRRKVNCVLLTEDNFKCSYLVNDKFLINLYKDGYDKNVFDRFVKFYLHNKGNEIIPSLYIYNYEPCMYQILEYVPGKSLLYTWKNLTDEEKSNVMYSLSSSLKKIHMDIAKEYDWYKYNKTKYKEIFSKVSNNFTKDDIKLLNNAFKKFKSYLSKNPRFVTVHGDINFKNIIYNEGKLSLLNYYHSMSAPIDYEFASLLRMSLYSNDYLDNKTDTFISVFEDFLLIYSEVNNVQYLRKRLDIYNLLYYMDKLILNNGNQVLIDRIISLANKIID